jgi:hypothetical protein
MLPRTISVLFLLAALAPAQQLAAPVADAFEECSVGVAAGTATADGRPLLWKNRDAVARDNVITAFRDGRFPYVALCNARATREVWGGANAAGFCIMNSVSRDLAQGSEDGPGNGAFMKLALQRCATVAEFEALLRETADGGRRTRANFGVIDAVGGAAIFETAHREHTRFDAVDGNQGIVVRTNFATTAGGQGGRERFARATDLCFKRPEGQELEHGYLLRAFCRDLLPPPSAVGRDDGRQDVRETIHRQTTVAAMVFHGVRDGEDASLTTMWAVLGQPLFSIAVPCFPAAKGVAAALAGAGADEPRSPICDAAKALQDALHEVPDGARTAAEDEVAGDVRWLRADLVPEVRDLLQPVEDRILVRTRSRLDSWRRASRPPSPAELLEFHREQAGAAQAAVEAAAERFAGATVRR